MRKRELSNQTLPPCGRAICHGLGHPYDERPKRGEKTQNLFTTTKVGGRGGKKVYFVRPADGRDAQMGKGKFRPAAAGFTWGIGGKEVMVFGG